ncbi:MAG: bifunctional UDP-sugar hydrolase/5'-nucleotidase [Halobacteriales archaeon]
MGVRLLQYSDVENAYDDPERIGRLAGTIAARRNGDTAVVGTGDNTAPGVLALTTGGRQALSFFERIDPDFEVPGNHDFDHGLDRTRDLIAASPQPWLCANARLDGDPFAGLDPAAIREVGGERLGFVGVLDPATPSITPEAASLEVTDPVDAVGEHAAVLRKRGADHVVVLSHLGEGDDDLARALDVDVVLGGHVHEERLDRIGGTLLTRPGATGRGLVEVELVDGRWRATRHDVTEGPLDGAVAAALRERREAAGLEEVVATAPEPIERSRPAITRGESPLGTIAAEAYRAAIGADVGLQNAGGIREGPALAGEVTAADLVGVVPFEEPVAIAEVPGATLREVLAWLRPEAGDPSARAGYVAGASTEWSTGTLVGATVGGDPLDPGATYTLATSDYVLYTDREFPALEPTHRVGTTDRAQYEILVEHAREAGLDGRAVAGGEA